MSELLVRLKLIAMFLLSPFIALAYMAAFPMVALKMLRSGELGRAEGAGRAD